MMHFELHEREDRDTRIEPALRSARPLARVRCWTG